MANIIPGGDALRASVIEELNQQVGLSSSLHVDAAVAFLSRYSGAEQATIDAAILELDDAVHDSMEDAEGTDDENSAQATKINNRGLIAQVACMMIGWGPQDGIDRLNEALPEPTRKI